jgi:molybdenum cofactor cytidylyltransferase
VQNSSDHIVAAHPTAGIILAAGASTRFGRPKQLLQLKGRCLLERVLDAALDSELNRIILVLGCAHQKIRQVLAEKLRHARLQIEVNPHYQKGQSHSLRLGLSRVIDTFPAVMFLLADQPLVDVATLNLMLDKFWLAGKDICVPVYRGKRGSPCIFGKNLYPQIMKITGDIGARQIIKSHPKQVLEIEIKNPLFFLDVDTPEDFEKIKKLTP